MDPFELRKLVEENLEPVVPFETEERKRTHLWSASLRAALMDGRLFKLCECADESLWFLYRPALWWPGENSDGAPIGKLLRPLITKGNELVRVDELGAITIERLRVLIGGAAPAKEVERSAGERQPARGATRRI